MDTIERRSQERGSALLMTLLILLSLTMIGGLFFAQTKTEVQIAGHDMRYTQALYTAQAGYAEVLARMSDMSDTTNYIGPAGQGWLTEPGWGRYLVLESGNAAGDPDYAATESDGME
jgi:type II secretory pathway component PulK